VYWNERLGKVKADDLALIASDVNGGGTGTDLSQASYTQNRAFRQTLEFAQEAYNYKTTSDDDPSNLVLLCTTQGMAIQQDGEGAKTIYHHVKEHGRVNRYWLEAESCSHKVGGSQVETKEEKDDALERGKATSSVIGTKAIGTRFNMIITIQVLLKQKDVKPHAEYSYMTTECSDFFGESRIKKVTRCIGFCCSTKSKQ
jgi:hypothetical protein